jgi:hypothetical protein
MIAPSTFSLALGSLLLSALSMGAAHAEDVPLVGNYQMVSCSGENSRPYCELDGSDEVLRLRYWNPRDPSLGMIAVDAYGSMNAVWSRGSNANGFLDHETFSETSAGSSDFEYRHYQGRLTLVNHSRGERSSRIVSIGTKRRKKLLLQERLSLDPRTGLLTYSCGDAKKDKIACTFQRVSAESGE